MYKIKMTDLEKLSKAAKSFKGKIILIQEEENKVFVTNLEDCFFVPAITSGEKITLKYEKQFNTIVSFFKKQKVDEIEVNQENFKSGSIVFNHSFYSKDNSIDINLLHEEEYKKIGGYGILKQMQDLLPFSSKDNQRYVLNGVAIKDGAIVATDARRLSCYTFGDKTINIITSNQTIKICGMIFKNITNLDCKINDKFICFSDGQSEYYGRFIEGVYPNWRQVIPEEKRINYKYEIIGLDLFDKINLLKIKTTKESPKSLTFVFQKDKVSITNSVGLVLDVPIKQEKESDGLELYADQNYFDFLKDKKEVKIEMVNRQNPIIFKDDTMLTVIMPMRKI